MRIPEVHRKVAAFLCTEKKGETTGAHAWIPVATAFFILVPPVVYAVTARHCIIKARANALRSDIRIRINTKDGRFVEYATSPDEWDEDTTTDIACIAVEPQDIWDVEPMPIERFLTDEVITQEDIGIGDEVCAVGLFSKHYGQKRNLPLVRFGRISMMPDEHEKVQIEMDIGYFVQVSAYLVEALSWGGFSGSPVYFIPTPYCHQGGIEIKAGNLQAPLLGLISGHFNIESIAEGDEPDIDYGQRVRHNSGIATVIPSQHIHNLLFSEDIQSGYLLR